MTLATWMSFARAGQELTRFTGVTVGTTTVRRMTEKAGAAFVAVQTAEAARITREAPPAPQGPAVQFLSVDGAMVPLVGGTWTEVRTLAVGEVVVREARTRRDRERTVHTEHLSYFSRLCDHETFGQLAGVETQRRGTETAGVVCAVADGAPWIQGVVDLHRPDAVRILDWPHALEYVARVGAAVYGADTAAAAVWLARQKRTLLTDTPTGVLAEMRRLRSLLEPVAQGGTALLVWTVAPERGQGGSVPLTGMLGPEMARRALEVVRESLGYLEPRVAQMRYAAFRAADYPVGSGSIESANKLLVEARLKGAGRHWARAHVNPLVALRTVAYNDRWTEAWPQITTQQRTEARTCSTARRQTRLHALESTVAETAPAAGVNETQVQLAVLPLAPSTLPLTKPSPPRVHKPAADHPWRHGSLRRPRCA